MMTSKNVSNKEKDGVPNQRRSLPLWESEKVYIIEFQLISNIIYCRNIQFLENEAAFETRE